MSRVPLDTVIRNGAGRALTGRDLYVYDRGTTDEVTGYTTEGGATTVTYPLTTNAEGRIPAAWYPPGAYDLYSPDDAVNPTQPWEAVQWAEAAASADISVTLEAPLNIEYSEYGASPANSAAANLTAIQAALDDARVYEASGPGEVLVPNGTFEVSGTLDVPQSVCLRGVHEDGSSIKASSTFTTTDPLINLGGTDTAIPGPFGCRIERLQVDARDRVEKPVYSPAINEHSGVRGCRITNATKFGIVVEDTASQTPQNFALQDIDIQYATIVAGAIGIRLVSTLATLAAWRVSDITIDAASGTMDAGIRCEGIGAFISHAHIENAAIGVDLGTAAVPAGFGPVVIWLTAAGATDAVRIRAGHAGNSATLIGISNAGGTNLVKDDVSGKTVTLAGENNLGFYALGSYTGGPVITSAVSTKQLFRDVQITETLDHDGTTAGFFNTTPIAKPTGVAVTAGGIHAALVALGLISA